MWRHTTGRADTGPCPRRHAARGCSASVTSIGALAGAGLRACGPPRSVVGFQPGTDAPPGGSMRSSTTIHHSLACLLSLAAIAVPFRSVRADEGPDVRLGRDVVPVFQRVQLRLDPDKRSYSGSVHVELTVAKPTDLVRFHADGQRLTRVRLAQQGDSVGVTRVAGDHGLQTLTTAHP